MHSVPGLTGYLGNGDAPGGGGASPLLQHRSLGRRRGPGGVRSGVEGRNFGDGIREEEDAAAAFRPQGGGEGR